MIVCFHGVQYVQKHFFFFFGLSKSALSFMNAVKWRPVRGSASLFFFFCPKILLMRGARSGLNATPYAFLYNPGSVSVSRGIFFPRPFTGSPLLISVFVSQTHISSASDVCKEYNHLYALWGLIPSTDVTSRTFRFLFFQGLLEQCSPAEYSLAWFIQLASNSLGIKISQFHPLSVVDSPACGSYFSDACLVYTPAFHEKYAICLPSCDLIMCQSSFTGGEPLSPVQLYAMDDYCMNHWSLLFQISPSISLGSFPLEECKTIKLPLPVDILFASTAVVDQDKDVCTSETSTFGILEAFDDEPEEQVLFS